MRGCRIEITSNKAISEELYDYLITLDKKRVENYDGHYVIEKEHSDIDATIDKFDTVIIFKTVNLTNARAIELSKDQSGKIDEQLRKKGCLKSQCKGYKYALEEMISAEINEHRVKRKDHKVLYLHSWPSG